MGLAVTAMIQLGEPTELSAMVSGPAALFYPAAEQMDSGLLCVTVTHNYNTYRVPRRDRWLGLPRAVLLPPVAFLHVARWFARKGQAVHWVWPALAPQRSGRCGAVC